MPKPKMRLVEKVVLIILLAALGVVNTYLRMLLSQQLSEYRDLERDWNFTNTSPPPSLAAQGGLTSSANYSALTVSSTYQAGVLDQAFWLVYDRTSRHRLLF